MRHRRTYLPAAQFVDQMVRKYPANRCWVWELLEAYFNIIKGIGCVMTISEMLEAEDLIAHYLKED